LALFFLLFLVVAPLSFPLKTRSGFLGYEGGFLVVFIARRNLLSLLPAVYPLRRKGEVTLSLALVLVGASFLVSTSLSLLKGSTPEGSPLFLISFLNLIEAVSKLIRVITLGVRLRANISSGHLLIDLVSGLLLLEVGISLVQGYIYSFLSSLYLRE
jgi:F0F1-type ATP synthase membrane subunit a